MSIGDFPESLSQAMLVGIMLVGGLGVPSVAQVGKQGELLTRGYGVMAGGYWREPLSSNSTHIFDISY